MSQIAGNLHNIGRRFVALAMSVTELETLRENTSAEMPEPVLGVHSTGGPRERARLERELARNRERFFASLNQGEGIGEFLAEGERPLAAFDKVASDLGPARRAALDTLEAVDAEKKRLTADETEKDICLREFGNLINLLDCINDNIAAVAVSAALRSALDRVERDELSPHRVLEQLRLGIGDFFERFADTRPATDLVRRYSFLEGPPGDVSPEIKEEIDRFFEPILRAIDAALDESAEVARGVVKSAVRDYTTAMAVSAEAAIFNKSILGRISRFWNGLFGGTNDVQSRDKLLRELPELSKPHHAQTQSEMRTSHAKSKWRASLHVDDGRAKGFAIISEALEASADEHRADEVRDLRQELAYHERAIATNTDPSHMHTRLTREEKGEILATIERIKRDLARLGQSPHA